MVRCSSGPRQLTAACPSTNMPIEIDLHAVRDRRQDHVADLGRLRAGDPEDAGDREPEHVGIHQPDPQAARREGDREVRGDGGLADAALAARDREDLRQRVRAELLLLACRAAAS